MKDQQQQMKRSCFCLKCSAQTQVAEAKVRFCFAMTKVGRMKKEAGAVGTVEVPGAVTDTGVLCLSC